MKQLKIDPQKKSYTSFIAIVLTSLMSVLLTACIHPTKSSSGIMVSGDSATDKLSSIYILTPHLYRYDPSNGFRKIHEFQDDTHIIFHNDSLVVIYENPAWQDNIMHVFNLNTGEHFEKKYERKCTYDGGIEHSFHTRLEDGELVTYWGCEDDGYRLGLQSFKFEKVSLENAGITTIDVLSKELRNEYYSSEQSIPAPDYNIDTTKFKIYKKYHRLWHLKDTLDYHYLTDGKRIFKLEVAETEYEDWN